MQLQPTSQKKNAVLVTYFFTNASNVELSLKGRMNILHVNDKLENYFPASTFCYFFVNIAISDRFCATRISARPVHMGALSADRHAAKFVLLFNTDTSYLLHHQFLSQR